MPIDAVIFDFGGVILDIDYGATVRALSQVLKQEPGSFYSQHRQSPLFDEIETGAISEEAFFRGLEAMAGRKVPHNELEDAWNAMLGGVRRERLDFVRDVSQHHRTFLLSNTNSIHKRAFDRTLAKVLGSCEAFEQLFEKPYYSHLLGLRKPDAAIFEWVLRTHGLRPETTLFIDDSEQHIRGARALGLQTYHLQTELLDSELPARLLPSR
jgi:putative hydrolase of the HAD superfamily